MESLSHVSSPTAPWRLLDGYQSGHHHVHDELVTLGPVPRADIDLTLPQRRLLDFCRAEGIACLDLLPLFAGSSDLYLVQDTHWNEKGNLVAAQAIAPWLDGLIH